MHPPIGADDVTPSLTFMITDEAGILREKDGGKFRYDAYRGDPQANKERYEEIGKVIMTYDHIIHTPLPLTYIVSNRTNAVSCTQNTVVWVVCGQLKNVHF